MYFNTPELMTISNKREAYANMSHKQIQFICKKIQSKYLNTLTEIYTLLIHTYIFTMVSLHLFNYTIDVVRGKKNLQ